MVTVGLVIQRLVKIQVSRGEIILVDDAFHTPDAAAACVATQEATLVRLPDIHDAFATKADFFFFCHGTQPDRLSEPALGKQKLASACFLC